MEHLGLGGRMVSRVKAAAVVAAIAGAVMAGSAGSKRIAEGPPGRCTIRERDGGLTSLGDMTSADCTAAVRAARGKAPK